MASRQNSAPDLAATEGDTGVGSIARASLPSPQNRHPGKVNPCPAAKVFSLPRKLPGVTAEAYSPPHVMDADVSDTSSGSASLALPQQPVTSEQCSGANRVSLFEKFKIKDEAKVCRLAVNQQEHLTGLSTDTVRTDCRGSVTMATPADRRCADEDTHSDTAELQPPPKRRLDVGQGIPTAATSRRAPSTTRSSPRRSPLTSPRKRASPRRKTGERTSPSNTAMTTDDFSGSNDDEEEQPGTPDPSQNKPLLSTYRKGEVVWCRCEDPELFWPARVIKPYDESQDCVTVRFLCHMKSNVQINNVTEICSHTVDWKRHRSDATSMLSGRLLDKFNRAYSKALELYWNADLVTHCDLNAVSIPLSRLQSKADRLEIELKDQADRLLHSERKLTNSLKTGEGLRETCKELELKVVQIQEAQETMNSEWRMVYNRLGKTCSDRFFNLQADLAGINAKCTALDGSNVHLAAKCTELQTKGTEMEERSDHLEGKWEVKCTEMEAKCTEMEARWEVKYTEMEAKCSELQVKGTEMEVKYTEMEVKYTEMEGRWASKCTDLEAKCSGQRLLLDEKLGVLDERMSLSGNRFVLSGIEEEGEESLESVLSFLPATEVHSARRISSKQQPRQVRLDVSCRGRDILVKHRHDIHYKGKKVYVKECMSGQEWDRHRSNLPLYNKLRDKQIPCSLPRSRILDDKGRPMSLKQICSLLKQPMPSA